MKSLTNPTSFKILVDDVNETFQTSCFNSHANHGMTMEQREGNGPKHWLTHQLVCVY